MEGPSRSVSRHDEIQRRRPLLRHCFVIVMIVETTSPEGGRQEIQLKGSGRTPFSRSADGLAVLRSGVREYLCAEGEPVASNHLFLLSFLTIRLGCVPPLHLQQPWPLYRSPPRVRSPSSRTRQTSSKSSVKTAQNPPACSPV